MIDPRCIGIANAGIREQAMSTNTLCAALEKLEAWLHDQPKMTAFLYTYTIDGREITIRVNQKTAKEE